MPALIQAGKRWVVERTNSWMNGFGNIRRCTDRNAQIIDFYLYLAAVIVTVRQLIQRAHMLYAGRPADNPPTQVTPIAGRTMSS